MVESFQDNSRIQDITWPHNTEQGILYYDL